MNTETNFQLQTIEKRLSELEYRARAIEPAELKELFVLMKEFGIQRLNAGQLMIEMPYMPTPTLGTLGYLTTNVECKS